MKLKEIKKEADRDILRFVEVPKTIAAIAAECDISYNVTCTKLMVFKEKGWVIKTKNARDRKSYYHLNKDEIEL
jgi:hypothetical protein